MRSEEIQDAGETRYPDAREERFRNEQVGQVAEEVDTEYAACRAVRFRARRKRNRAKKSVPAKLPIQDTIQL